MAEYPDRNIGKKRWAISGGRIPLRSTGEEPVFTSRDVITVLNARDSPCELQLTVCFADTAPQGPYRFSVPAQRLKKIGFHELINPLPVPLDTPFGCVIEASHEVVVQFFRMDTSAPETATAGTVAFGGE